MGVFAEAGRQVGYQAKLTRLLGWRDAVRFRAAMVGSRLKLHDGANLRLRPSNLAHPVELRIASTDAEVYGQVLREEEYAAFDGADVRTIVDCGANVGYTSAWMLSRYPHARVIAIEPYPSNAEQCRRNLVPYGERATVIEAAVWNCCTRLVLDHAGGNEWGVRVRQARQDEPGDIEALDLPSLGLDHIDILKVDIEGSETDLFASGTERWLPTVSNIAIELHGPACERQFRAAMAAYAFQESRSGELTICRNIRPSGDASSTLHAR